MNQETNATPSFTIKDGMESEYQEFRAKGMKNPFAGGIIRYAERWGRMMDQEIEAGAAVADIAARTSHTADTEGASGFMYGMAVNLLHQYWEHGEELRQWHNQRYHYSGEGVVNPAILTPPANGDDGPDMEPEEFGPTMSQ